MPDNKTYKVGDDLYDIPDTEAESFLKDNPHAVQVNSFVVGKDTLDIPVNEVDAFLKDNPDAAPLKKKDQTSPSISPSTAAGSVSATPSTGKIKHDNASAVSLGKSSILKKKMFEAFSSNTNPVYRKTFMDTLEKKGYSREELEAFAGKIDNYKDIEQQRSDLAARQAIDQVPDQRMHIGIPAIDDYIDQQGELLQHGAEKTGTALANISGMMGIQGFLDDKSLTTKLKDLGGEAIHAATGTAQAGFALASSSVPLVVALNAATQGAHALPDDVKKTLSFGGIPEDYDGKKSIEAFDKQVDLPFTIATNLANAAGIKPKEGSVGADVIELLNYAILPVALKKMGGVSEFKNVDDLNTFYEKLKNGEATELELKDYAELTKQLQGLTIEEVQEQANKALDEMPVENDALHTKLATLQKDQDKLSDQDKSLLQPQIEAVQNEISDQNKSQVLSDVDQAHKQASVFDINDQILGLEEKKEGLSDEGKAAIGNTIDQLSAQRDAITEQLADQDATKDESQRLTDGNESLSLQNGTEETGKTGSEEGDGAVKRNSEGVEYLGRDAISERGRVQSEKDFARKLAKEKISNPDTNASLKAANAYNKSVGLPEVTPHKFKPSDPVLQTKIAQAFTDLQDVNRPDYVETPQENQIFLGYKAKFPEIFKQYDIKDYKDLVKKSYDQLIVETQKQYDALPVKISFHEGDKNYENSQDMLDDVHNYNHLHVYKGGDDHVFLGNKTIDKDGLTANDKFRAVHDYFGHSIDGYQFGKDGEENAWIEHSKMFSPLAQIALSTETRGQNSYVNYSGVNEATLQKIRLGSIRKKQGLSEGNEAMVAEGQAMLDEANREFQYADQKGIALPVEFTDISQYHKIGEPPVEPPITSNEVKPAGPKREKGVLGSLANRSELTDTVKKAIANKTLEYEQYSNKDALSVADGIIAQMKEEHGDKWIDPAVDFASVKQPGIPLSINAMVLGRVVSHFQGLEKATDVMSEKLEYADMAADVAERMDDLARDFGRFNSAIQEVYNMSALAVKSRIKKKLQKLNDAKLDEKYRDGESARQKIAKAYDEFEKVKKDFADQVDREVNKKMDEIMAQLPKEHKSYAKKAVDALDKLEKDIMSGKIAFSSVIPPPVAVAIIRTAKVLIKGGMLAHDAIKKAIDKHKAEHPKDDIDFTEAIPKFKDYLDKSGVDDGEFKGKRKKRIESKIEEGKKATDKRIKEFGRLLSERIPSESKARKTKSQRLHELASEIDKQNGGNDFVSTAGEYVEISKEQDGGESVSDLESLVKKVENDFKNPKPKKPGVEITAAEEALTNGAKLPSDYTKEISKIGKEREAIDAKLQKLAEKQEAEEAKAKASVEKAMDKAQSKESKDAADQQSAREKEIERMRKGAELREEQNARAVQKQLDAAEERRLRREQEKLEKEQKILEEALKIFDGTTVKEAEMKVLDKLFPKKRIESAKKRQAVHEKILEAYNNGALDLPEFEKQFYDKFGLVDADKAEIKSEMEKFADRIHNAADGGLKEREYTAMLNFLEDRRKQSVAEWFTTPFYANILSGYETHLNNTQFNIMSGIAQTALIAEKNPGNAKFLAMKMLSNFPAALTHGANVLMSGIKYGSKAAPESLAERRADKGPGVSHYFKLPGRMLQAADAVFNTPIKAMKRAELLLKIADNYNRSLPEEQRKNKKELQADINDIMFQTTERKAQALEQAKKDIMNLEGANVDFSNKKIARDLKLRQFEIMETSRPEDKYLQYGIDYDGVKQDAQNFANASLLQGKPVGSLGGVSTILETAAQVLPISRFAITTFVNVPLNLANMMIDKSPLGFIRAIRGKRGIFISDEIAQKHGIKKELTADERKEAYIRAANYSAALLGVAALTGMMYTDDKGNKRRVLEVTGDGTGDYQKNKALKFSTGGEFKEYTADFMGFQFSYKYNSILAPIFTPLGAMSDFEKYKDRNPEQEKAVYAKVLYGLQSYLQFVGDQANLQGFRDLFSSESTRTSVDLNNDLEKNAEKFARSGGKILRNLLVPNFLIQANKDAKGLMEMADKKPVEWYDYTIKDVPLVESIMRNRYDHYGRDIKSEFHLPVILVPDKLNIESKDPYYKMDIDHGYDPTFVKNKVVFDGDAEIDLTPEQMDDMNRMRGEYVLKKLQSTEKLKDGKTYMELLDGLSKKDYAEEKNRLFKDGELYAKSKILGLDVEKEAKDLRKQHRKEDAASGKKKLSKIFQRFRDRVK